jgi:hypothetical protein
VFECGLVYLEICDVSITYSTYKFFPVMITRKYKSCASEESFMIL